MTELHTHRLDGCAPTPLASYLKALGTLRLLATATNNVKGEAADRAARGWWASEHFHLRTPLDRDALLRFFLEDYAPSPIIAPWNAGSGFYYREGHKKDPLTGKKIKTGIRDAATTATRRIDAIVRSGSPRFVWLIEAINAARTVITEFGLGEAPDTKAGQKAAFVDRYRSLANDEATVWVDAAIAVTGEQFDSAALLGSGGNDGNLDFSTAFQAAVLSVIDPQVGAPTAEAALALDCALFDRAITGAWSAGVSQLAPGNIEAANSGNGFEGAERGDPWSLVLMFEGAIAFAGAATRRGAANRARGSFPFTVSQLASGSGAVGGDDDQSKRAAELWLPLWDRPTTFSELRALLGEGRARIGRIEARDGLTFARAVATLGVSRGIAEFERVAFEARYGNMFITVPLGRFRTPRRPRNDPIADLDAGGWLARLRRGAGEKNAPARARMTVRRLEDALFDIAREGHERDALQGGLAALGSAVSWLATSPEGRNKMPPPPRLGRQWVHGADDGSAEFRIAAALASLGWRESAERNAGEEEDEEAVPNSIADAEDQMADEGVPSDGSVVTGRVDNLATRRKSPPPMAAHFAPVDEETIGRRFRRWAESDSAGLVWGAGGLVQNMIAVLERRLIEQASRGLDDKPLGGAAPARLADIAAFLEGPPAFDDARCAALLGGLVWAQPSRFHAAGNIAPMPFAYAVLKPLFTPDDDLRAKRGSDVNARQFLPESGKLPIPPGLVTRLRRGAIDDAVREALGRARASGIGSPFDVARKPAGAARFGAARLAAALLVPIGEDALTHCMERAYPGDRRKKETDNAA